MKPSVLKPRSRGQRVFYHWLEEAQPKLRIPIQIEKQTRDRIEFSFAGVPTILRGIIYFRRYRLPAENGRRMSSQKNLSGEMTVFVDWEGATWDLLFSWDAFPVKTANGYICDQCPPEHYRTFESREAIWKDHLFEPLLKWVNEDLCFASAIGIYANRGATWAKLLQHDQKDKEVTCRIAKVEIGR
jgi:hypothetical protein